MLAGERRNGAAEPAAPSATPSRALERQRRLHRLPHLIIRPLPVEPFCEQAGWFRQLLKQPGDHPGGDRVAHRVERHALGAGLGGGSLEATAG